MSPNMFSLVAATAQDMPDEPLRPEDLPSQNGFLWLGEPISELDIRGRLLRHHAVVWAAVGSQVAVSWFADRSDNRDEINQNLRREKMRDVGRFMLAESTVLHFGKDLPKSPDTTSIRQLRDYDVLPDDWEISYDVSYETFTDDEGLNHIRYTPVVARDWMITDEQFSLIEDAYEALHDTERINPGLKQLVCFWRLCQQTLTAKEYHPPNRALRKQLIRRKMVPKAVTVITLRRRKSTGESQNHVEWDHRWVRRGHWRQQWFGSYSTERYQRAIYINPTICGPEDKPLIIRPHVNVLKR